MPERIQRKRTKGWRMPEGAVYVGRGSKWGNPYRVGPVDEGGLTPKQAVNGYAHRARMFPITEEIRRELRGKDLACWCPLTDANGQPVPCHADVLLEIANG